MRKVDFKKSLLKLMGGSIYSTFPDIAGKPEGLICGGNVTVIKEFNLQIHCETKKC